MIGTLHTVAIFMVLMSDVSTLSIRRIKRENNLRNRIHHDLPKLSSEESLKPLKYIDPTNISEVIYFQNGAQNLESLNKAQNNVTEAKISTKSIYSKSDFFIAKGVFPEDHFSQDVLTLVQKEGFYGFPKGKNQQFNKNTASQTAIEKLYKENDENITNGKYIEPAIMFTDKIKEAQFLSNQEHLRVSEPSEIKPKLNLPTISKKNNNKSETINNTKGYLQNVYNNFEKEKSTNLSMIFVPNDENIMHIKDGELPTIQEPGKSRNTYQAATSYKLESGFNASKKLTNQMKQDEIQAQNAMYKFSTSQNDGISDLQHERTETRHDGKVAGSYSYSDGFFFRKVNYVADKNGYRIISEVTMPLPGNGPMVNSNGTAEIRSDVNGLPLHYVVHGGELPTKASHH